MAFDELSILGKLAVDYASRLVGSASFANCFSRSFISIDEKADLAFDELSILGKLAVDSRLRLLGSASCFKLASKSLMFIDEKSALVAPMSSPMPWPFKTSMFVLIFGKAAFDNPRFRLKSFSILAWDAASRPCVDFSISYWIVYMRILPNSSS